MQKHPLRLTLNNGFIILLNSLPIILNTFVYINNSVAIKKGKRVGTTLFANNNNPFFTDKILLFAKTNKPKVKNKKNIEITFLLSFKTYLLDLFIRPSKIFIFIIIFIAKKFI